MTSGRQNSSAEGCATKRLRSVVPSFANAAKLGQPSQPIGIGRFRWEQRLDGSQVPSRPTRGLPSLEVNAVLVAYAGTTAEHQQRSGLTELRNRRSTVW